VQELAHLPGRHERGDSRLLHDRTPRIEHDDCRKAKHAKAREQALHALIHPGGVDADALGTLEELRDGRV
jgi:hypothetical protein